MKKAVLLILAAICSLSSIADTYYFAWDGLGFATRNNYNLGYSYGSYQYKGIANGVGIGGMEIFQQYNMFYDREGTGAVGASLRYNITYRFVSPMVVFQLGKSGQTQCYGTAGLGEIKSGTVEMRKWSRVPWSSVGETYDSTLDQTTMINSYVIRLGFGLTHFYKLGGNFHLFLNEDVGFLVSPTMDPSEPNYAALHTNASQFFKPTYISLRIGIAFITHSRDSKTPYRIYYKDDNAY